jgi:hypothetical protein
MNIEYPVYADDEIAVVLLAKDQSAVQKNLFSLAVRYLLPKSYQQKNGNLVETTNLMGGETAWFILPHSFGTVVGKRLIEQKISGLPGFNEDGYTRMISWLVEMGELHDAMVY